MAISSDINSPSFQDRMAQTILREMQKEIDAVAAPIIEKALADIQKAMLARLGGLAVQLFQTSFDVQRYGQDVRLTVILKEPKS